MITLIIAIIFIVFITALTHYDTDNDDEINNYGKTNNT